MKNILSKEQFDEIQDRLHSDCDMDSETIDDNIQRIICYDHNEDWLVNIKLPNDTEKHSQSMR